MEIRAIRKDYKKFKNLYNGQDGITLTEDDSIPFSVIMILDQDGKLLEWTRGRENISSFLKYGYVRIRKQCPYRHRKCIGEKCSLYFIKNGTGDCALIWAVV